MYFEPLNITFATNMVTVNLDAFDKLPKAQQDILVSLGKEQEEAAWEDVRRWGGDTEAIISKNGIETVQPSKQFISNLEKAAKVIWADWLKTATPDGKKIYEEFTKKVKR